MSSIRVFILAVMLATATGHANDYVDFADANGDGFVSLYELRAAHYADPEFNRRIEQSFERYDRNGDGLISQDERQVNRAAAEPAKAKIEAAASGMLPTAAVPQTSAPVVGDKPVEPQSGATPQASISKKPDLVERGGTADTQNLSRTELWIREIDADNSGGASMAELIASGDGQQWFSTKAFEAADRNGDRDLDPDELAALVSSLERRQR